MHMYAIPTLRLIEVEPITQGMPSPEWKRYDLNDDEDGVIIVPFDGDTGRRIIPPKPAGPWSRFFDLLLPYAMGMSMIFNLVVIPSSGMPWINFGCAVMMGVTLWWWRARRLSRRVVLDHHGDDGEGDGYDDDHEPNVP